jgi:hypothetical protein
MTDKYSTFFRQEVFVKDFLMPVRIVALLYILVSFFLPVGWNLIKNTILLFLKCVYTGNVLWQGASITSLFLMWYLYVADLVVVGYLFYYFIKQLNKKGIKKIMALLPIVGLIVLMLLFVIIIGTIDRYLPFINLYETLVVIDNFLK